MEKGIGVAVVGYGFMGSTHMVAWKMVEGSRILAVIGRNVEMARRSAERYGARAYGSLKDALKNEAIEIVDICTPTHTHRELAVEALEAGKHVLVEKPMAISLKDADEMIRAARKAGLKLMVAHVLRFFADYAKAKALLDEGLVGEPVIARAQRESPSPAWGAESWFIDQAKSGGVTVDLAIHDVDFLRWCLEDEVRRVYARACRREFADGRRLEDHVLMILRFRRGCIAHVEASWAMPKLYPFTTSLEIAGTKGILNLDNQSTTPITIITDKGIDRISPESLPWIPGMPFPIDPYVAEIRHFFQCVLEDRKPLTDGEESKRSLEVVLAAAESVAFGKPIDLPLGG
ncbi:MAG: Gfo/Idh/MocA family oxidoreductase [Candidatus Bathyarchaeia archaeon]